MSQLQKAADVIAREVGPWYGGDRGPTEGAKKKALKVAYALADAGLLALPDDEQQAADASR